MLRTLILLWAAMICASTMQALAQTATDAGVPSVALSPAESEEFVLESAGLFSEVLFQTQKETRPGVYDKERSAQTTIGGSVGLTPWLTAIIGGTYTHADKKLLLVRGTEDRNGITGFGGAIVHFINNTNLTVVAGSSLTDIDGTLQIGTEFVANNRLSLGRFAVATLDTSFNFEKVRVSPFTQFLYYDNREPSGFYSNGLLRGRFFDTVGRASFGAEVAYTFRAADYTIEPTFRAALLYDTNLPSGYTDRTAFELTGGLKVSADQLSANVRVSSTVGRTEIRNTTLRGTLNYSF